MTIKNLYMSKPNENEIIDKENPYRDEHGRFTTEDNDAGGGGGGIGEYSNTAGSGELVSTIDEAIEKLGKGTGIMFERPDQVVSLLDKLNEIAKEASDRGEAAPVFDLCKVSVKGTNLFCADNVNITRDQMPQLSGIPVPGSPADKLPRGYGGNVDLGPAFKEDLMSKGFKVEDTTVQASRLRASQNQLDGVKVASLMKAIESGKVPPARLFVSKENYIIDGHHRWAANIGLALKGKDVKMEVARIDMPILKVLKSANDFAAKNGIGQLGLGKALITGDCGCRDKSVAERIAAYILEAANSKENPYHDEHGRFTTEDNDVGGGGGGGGSEYISSPRGLASSVAQSLGSIGLNTSGVAIVMNAHVSVDQMNKAKDQIKEIADSYTISESPKFVDEYSDITFTNDTGNFGVRRERNDAIDNISFDIAGGRYKTDGTSLIKIDDDKKDMYAVAKTMGELIAGGYAGRGKSQFWNELESVRQDYAERVEDGRITSDHKNYMGMEANSGSNTSFATEGFASYTLNSKPDLYSRKVGELYNKHFGKSKKSDARVINNTQKNLEMKNETTPKTHDELLVIGRKKIATHYKVKDNPDTGTKDVDFTKRIVAAIPNTYLWFDSDQDVLMPGSAAKTISERGPKSKGGVKIKNVKDHVISDRIGNIQVLDERKVDGKDVIYGESKMLKTTLGNDMLIEYQEGVIDQHSIGFKYNDIQLVTADDKDWSIMLKRLINPKDAEKVGYMFVVKDFTKFEYSPVSFGANVLTPYLGVKSDNKEAMQLKVFERLDLLNKQLRNGRQSDETMYDYELEILQLKQIISELFTEEPSIKATLLAERRQNKDTEQPNKENPIEVEGEVEDEKTKCIVTCPGCQKEFDWLSIEESGMGYVKCPSCTEPVTQEGKKWYDLIEVIKKTQFI